MPRTEEEIHAEIKKIEYEIDSAPQWGAGVAIRLEHLQDLYRELAYLKKDQK